MFFLYCTVRTVMNVRDSGHRDGKKGREKGGIN